MKRGLGHSVAFDDRRLEHALELGQDLRRQGSGRGADEPQRISSNGVSMLRHLRQDRLMDGGRRGIPGWPEFLDPSGELV